MQPSPRTPSVVRCLLVLLAISVGAGTVLSWLLPDLAAFGAAVRAGSVADRPFDRLLVEVCRLAVAGCTLWLATTATVVAADAARGRTTHRGKVPRLVRQVVLVACGLALVGGLAPAAHADDAQRADAARQSLLDGLPLPDRATATMHVSQVFARAVSLRERARPTGIHPGVAVVRSGDTLWELARTGLPEHAGDRAVAERVRQIYDANRALIGPDPDLIRPHQRLRMPQPGPNREESR